MPKKVLLFFSIFVTSFFSFAQGRYGFEWIKPYQPYFKFNVAQQGIFRIDIPVLQNAGINLTALHPERFQLFRNGIEVPIFIHGDGDGLLNGSDFLEFFAQPNDGKFDTLLYGTSTKQPHPWYSLFNDTAYYFLTILPDTSLLRGKRLQGIFDANVNAYTPEDYVLAEVKVFPTEEYLNGPDFAGIASEVRYYLSDYDEGEGWASSRIGLGSQRTFSLSTPSRFIGGPDPQLEIKVIGASNAFSNFPFNHHVQLQLGADNANYSTIADRTFSGYQVQLFNPSISANQIGNTTTDVLLRIINDLGVAADFNCLSYAKLLYARSLNLNNSSALLSTLNHQKGGGKTRLQFTNYALGKTSPIIYDLSLNQRIQAIYNLGTVNAAFTNSANQQQVFITDSTNIISINALQPVSMRLIDAQENYEFIIVSNNRFASAVNAYQQYRSNRFKVLSVTSDELYNTYTFGNNHPLAIRRLATHLLNEAPQDPQYLLLAGRGYQNNLTRSNTKYYEGNLVPAVGIPSSDAMFTAGIIGNGTYADIPTGRIPATSEIDLNNYLQKLIDYETASDSILPWRKEILHVTGGTGLGEQTSFINQFRNNERTIRGKYFGANVTSFNKNNAEPQQADLRDQILAVQNRGVSMVSFYGHASLTILDVDIGRITDLNNVRKYPLYYFSGCNVGNANAEDPGNTGDVYAKDYLCFPNKGAIGWLAHTNFSYTNNLDNLLNSFYQRFSVTNYGSSIGKIMTEVAKSMNATDPITKSHNIQWLYQGDPATVIYSPKLPDHSISNSSLFISPTNASVQLDSFAVGIIVSNNARATDDSVEITVTRTLPDSKRIVEGPFKMKPVFYRDTFYVWFKGKEASMIGNNTFDVAINKGNNVVESSVLNNDASFSFFLPGQGLQLIEPTPYSIVTSDTLKFLIQSNNVFAKNNEYVIELDTSFNFTSPVKKSSGILNGNDLVSWNVIETKNDTTVYYWRARLNVSENEGGVWSNSSFTHIKNGAKGWTQRAFDQYTKSGSTTDLVFDSIGKQLQFRPNFRSVKSIIGRWFHGGIGILAPYVLNPAVGSCIDGGLVCVLFEKNSLVETVNPKFPLNCTYPLNNGGYYYAFDTRTSLGQQEFIRFVDSIETGTHIALYSYYDCGAYTWTPQMRQALQKLGSQKVAAIKSFYNAVALVGRKDAMFGTISEDTIFNDRFNSGANIPEDTLRAVAEFKLQGLWYTGTLASSPIGPSTSWNQLKFNFNSVENSLNERNEVRVFGVRNQQEDTLLYVFHNANEYSLAGINAKVFPFIRLAVSFTDSTFRTPNQFGYWSVLHQEAAEGSLSPQDQFEFYNATLNQGDTLRMSIAFKNISQQLLDSVPVKVEVVGSDRQLKYSSERKYPSLESGSRFVIEEKIPTKLMSGQNQLKVNVNRTLQVPERTLVNNVYEQSFEVKQDQRNPMLDVTFDGYRIMNGDFVSPTPTILIASKDDNAFLLQNDTSTFDLYLKRPRQSDYEKISNGTIGMRFIPATDQNNKAMLEYKPETLQDGLYKLKAIARDASGNASGNNAYEIEFNVVNESTITNFFPYPNPCTTNMRFVFTLTGAKPPDALLVRIMTVTGKVIREVNQDEFGPIKIGNNISDFAWDGTDNFGDRVANGVYLYQVQTRINGQGIKQRNTSADKYVTHGTGKIYLMR